MAMNLDNSKMIAHFMFKPIDMESVSYNSSDNLFNAQPVSPTEIFREMALAEEKVDHISNTSHCLLSVRRANPINSSECDDEMCSRVISPFSHTASMEELEEREQLGETLDWAVQLEGNESMMAKGGGGDMQQCLVDYSRFFDPQTLANNMDVMDCCDDFSLSSHEANSLSEDFCLETISEDPASFWEEGIDATPPEGDRPWSPNEVSLGASDHSS